MVVMLAIAIIVLVVIVDAAAVVVTVAAIVIYVTVHIDFIIFNPANFPISHPLTKRHLSKGALQNLEAKSCECANKNAK